MSVFRPYEIKAIRLMAESVISEEVLGSVLAICKEERYEYTGCGYYLTVKHPDLPGEQKSLSDPPVAGSAKDIQAGFIVYLGDGELTLECHTWGKVDVPSDFRDMEVAVTTPPENYVDLRGAA